MIRMCELGRQLERAPLRRLEALARWMEAIEIRPEMQDMLAEALEELRDLTLQLLTEDHANAEGTSPAVRWRDGARAVRSANGRMHMALTELPSFAATSPPETGESPPRRDKLPSLPRLLEGEGAAASTPRTRVPNPPPLETRTDSAPAPDELIAALSGSFLITPPEPSCEERRREKPPRNDFASRSGDKNLRNDFAARSGDKNLRNDFASRSGRVRLGR